MRHSGAQTGSYMSRGRVWPWVLWDLCQCLHGICWKQRPKWPWCVPTHVCEVRRWPFCWYQGSWAPVETSERIGVKICADLHLWAEPWNYLNLNVWDAHYVGCQFRHLNTRRATKIETKPVKFELNMKRKPCLLTLKIALVTINGGAQLNPIPGGGPLRPLFRFFLCHCSIICAILVPQDIQLILGDFS